MNLRHMCSDARRLVTHIVLVFTLATAVEGLIPRPVLAAETAAASGACARDAAVADIARLRAPSGHVVGRVTLTYATGGSAGFCGRIHVKPRFAKFGQVRYRLRVDAPGSTPAAPGATEPASHPHPIGIMCSCYTSGTTGTYRITFINDFYRPTRHKFLAKATVTGVLP